MPGFFLAKPEGGCLPGLSQQRWPLVYMVGVGGQDVHESLVQHAFGPIPGARPEAPGHAAGSDLHPGAIPGQPPEDFVVVFYPG